MHNPNPTRTLSSSFNREIIHVKKLIDFVKNSKSDASLGERTLRQDEQLITFNNGAGETEQQTAEVNPTSADLNQESTISHFPTSARLNHVITSPRPSDAGAPLPNLGNT